MKIIENIKWMIFKFVLKYIIRKNGIIYGINFVSSNQDIPCFNTKEDGTIYMNVKISNEQNVIISNNIFKTKPNINTGLEKSFDNKKINISVLNNIICFYNNIFHKCEVNLNHLKDKDLFIHNLSYEGQVNIKIEENKESKCN